ncbi:MAG: hypothetical protein M1838_001201 [Thelocarpon superellum]|nr:MAG: hypothetical protein M1838_001201 [Thelocarpon superellum]
MRSFVSFLVPVAVSSLAAAYTAEIRATGNGISQKLKYTQGMLVLLGEDGTQFNITTGSDNNPNITAADGGPVQQIIVSEPYGELDAGGCALGSDLCQNVSTNHFVLTLPTIKSSLGRGGFSSKPGPVNGTNLLSFNMDGTNTYFQACGHQNSQGAADYVTVYINQATSPKANDTRIDWCTPVSLATENIQNSQ